MTDRRKKERNSGTFVEAEELRPPIGPDLALPKEKREEDGAAEEEEEGSADFSSA